MEITRVRIPIGKILFLAIPWGLALFLFFYSSGNRVFADFYAANIYPVWVGSIGRALSYIPFAVGEIGLYFLVIYFAVRLGAGILGIIRTKKDALLKVRNFIYRSARLAGILCLAFMLFCGINYNRSTFADSIGLKVFQPSIAHLEVFLCYAAENINTLASTENFDADTDEDTIGEGVKAMDSLGENIEVLSGYFPRSKNMLWSDFLSYQHIAGIYSAFTVEAVVNSAEPEFEYRHSICHELSHLTGFMREDEANFISFLACINSDNIRYRYSGWLEAFIYVGNDLAKYDPDAYYKIRSLLCTRAEEDLVKSRVFWDQHDSKAAEVHEEMNDAYLKMNHQTNGVLSYNDVTRLIISYCFS